MSDGDQEYKTAIKEILMELTKTTAEDKRLRKAGLHEARVMNMGKKLGLITALELLRIPIESISLATELGESRPI